MKEKVLLHILGSLEMGGAERTTLDLCRTLDEYEHYIYLQSGQGGALESDFLNSGARIVKGKRSLIGSAVLLRRLMRSLPADAVVSHLALASGFFLFLAQTAGVPVRIARIHSSSDGKASTLRRGIYRVTGRFLLRISATHVLAVSRAGLRFAQLCSSMPESSRFGVLPNGVDLEKFRFVSLRPEGGAIEVVHIGRNAPEKNRRALLPILMALSDRHPARLRVVGAGPYTDLGQPHPGLEIVGTLSDVGQLLAGAHVLILPSLREGLPGVILEALAVGTPVVASDLPTLRELAHHVDGITLVPVSAPPSVWAEAILKASSVDRETRLERRLQLEGSQFDLGRSVEEWRHVLSN